MTPNCPVAAGRRGPVWSLSSYFLPSGLKLVCQRPAPSEERGAGVSLLLVKAAPALQPVCTGAVLRSTQSVICTLSGRATRSCSPSPPPTRSGTPATRMTERRSSTPTLVLIFSLSLVNSYVGSPWRTCKDTTWFPCTHACFTHQQITGRVTHCRLPANLANSQLENFNSGQQQ